jgi:hypothetical protein
MSDSQLIHSGRKIQAVEPPMQQSAVIPSPSGADTETVTTALETAAVFRAEGDAPRIGSSEALLVMLDPTSTLLAR